MSVNTKNVSAENFQGVMTAIVTPFKSGELDREAYKNLIERQINAGIKFIVPCGTTGESATLDHNEHEELIRFTMECTAGRAQVIAGAGSNSTSEAVRLQKFCEKIGVAATLHITPYYNKPTQSGLFAHYKAIAECSNVPVILYNVPGRTCVNISTETVLKLAEIPGIIGIKEASGDLGKSADILSQARPGFLLFSGEDDLSFALYSMGAAGTISVTANVVPELQVALFNAVKMQKIQEAQQLHFKMRELNRILFVETNPIPVKAALACMGLIREEYRLPLTPMEPQHRKQLLETIKSLGIQILNAGGA